MPIVDISGISTRESMARNGIRRRIAEYYNIRLGMPLDATTVTFIGDEGDRTGPEVHVMARLYSKTFMDMEQAELDEIGDNIVLILEEEAGHTFNEAFPISVMAMRGGNKPYKTGG